MVNFAKRDDVLMALRWVSLAFIIFLGLVFLAGQVVGIGALDEAMRRLSPGLVFTILFAVLLSNLLRFARWPFFAKVLGLNIPTEKLGLYYVAGMALLPTPGKAGTALRLWLLNRHHGIAYKKSAPMLLLDLITDGLAMVLLVAVALPWFGSGASIRLGVFMLLALIVGAVVVLYYPVLTRKIFVLARQAAGGRGGKLFTTLEQIAEDLRTLVGPRNLAIATGLAFGGWLLVALAFALLLQALGQGFALPLTAFAMGGGMVLGALSLLPGGLGSTEAALMAILLANGLNLADATIFTALLRLCTLWLPVAAGVAALPFALRRKG